MAESSKLKFQILAQALRPSICGLGLCFITKPLCKYYGSVGVYLSGNRSCKIHQFLALWYFLNKISLFLLVITRIIIVLKNLLVLLFMINVSSLYELHGWAECACPGPQSCFLVEPLVTSLACNSCTRQKKYKKVDDARLTTDPRSLGIRKF